jgi:hypothetical protein
MNDTPRTDDQSVRYYDDATGTRIEYVAARFARQLERELAAVTAQRDRLAEALRLISNGTSCRECGGEDQALFARESLQSLTPNAKQ